jgi:signal transduction histidine kinase
MKFKGLSRSVWFLIAGLVSLGIAFISKQWLANVLTEINFANEVRQAQKAIPEKDTLSTYLLMRLAAYSDKPSHEESTYLFHESDHNNIFLYIIENREVTYWTSNIVLPPTDWPVPPQNTEFATVIYSNGIYLQKSIFYHGRILVALVPVQYNYGIQNRYLKPYLVLVNDEDRTSSATLKPLKEGVTIKGVEGNYLFTLIQTGRLQAWWSIYFYLLGGLFIALAIHFLVLRFLLRKQAGISAIIVLVSIGLLFLFWKGLKLPSDIFQSDLFGPAYYASPVFFSSLGDLLITTCIACYLSWFIYTTLRRENAIRLSRWTIFCLFTFLLLAVTFMLGFITRSLILDSQLSLNLSNVFSLTIYSVLALVILFAWTTITFIIIRRYAVWLKRSFNNPRPVLIAASFFLLASTVAALQDVALLLCPLLALSGTFFTVMLMRGRQNTAIARGVLYLLLSSIFFTTLFGIYQVRKETETKRVVASKLAIQRDNVAEYLFEDIYRDISTDPYLLNFYANPAVARSFLEKRIQQLYFSGYMKKYEVVVTSYTSDGMPFKVDDEQPLEYYKEYLKKNTTEIRPNALYFLETYTGLPGYIAIIPVQRYGHTLGNLLLQFQRKAFYEESIYPELLLSEELMNDDEEDYEYAVYRNNVLLTQNGDFAYPGKVDFHFTEDSLGYGHFKSSGYRHLVYRVSNDIMVVVSTPMKSALTYFSNFSFLLLFFALCAVLFFLLPYVIYKIWQKGLWRQPISTVFRDMWSRFSFRFKILATVTGGISLALLLIGLVTIGYIVYQYNNDEVTRLKKRTRLINTGLENAFEEADPSTPIGEEELTVILKRLSDLRLLDINVFDKYGNLAATTQPALYQQQLLAPKMNASAMHKFRDHHASQAVQEEKIGGLRFMASYRPVRNPLGEVIGYLNIPYFMQERELTSRIATFLVALINLYLLLFVLLISVSVIMARALTEPLDLIRNHLRRASLRGNDSFLVWHNQDEIGKLVEEYNTALATLKENAARLSRSEREGAWKEIAQRVAHEISNPLTPMKLSIQRLQHAFAEDREDIQPLFDKVTNLLIGQIDALSELASNFGEYAKIPLGRPDRIVPSVIIKHTAELFSINSDIDIRLDLQDEDAAVFMDKNHFTQAFNNLMKNAMQAIPEGRHGLILLRMHTDPNWIYMEVHDNGTGIPEEMQEKIFIPHFSTKSFGTGQGLAITREMIEFAGGQINFETRAGEGTTFFVRLPRYKG